MKINTRLTLRASARNILILSLILEDVHGARNLQLWNIYYHLYLDGASLELLSTQVSKLYDLASSLKRWHNGEFGQRLRFCDRSTLDRVRAVWDTYRVPEANSPKHKQWLQNADAAAQRALKLRKRQMGESSYNLSGVRSAAPISIGAMLHAPMLERHFWKHGTTDEKAAGAPKANHANPMFVTDFSTLHYGTDPLLGFHLATAFSALDKNSPLQSKSMRERNLPFKVVEAAQVQFEAWGKAFRQSASEKTVVRFFAGDAINFSYALQHANSTKLKPANIYHDSYHWDPIVLDGPDYAKAGNGPLRYNVIDTSNLMDHLGPLNLLVAIAPLLHNSSSSSAFTECLVQRENSLREYIDSLLCGHFPTVSLLLGLFPVEYWANLSPYSTVDDLLLDSNYGSTNNSTLMKQRHIKLTWKPTVAGLVSYKPDTPTLLQMDEIGLARTLHQVYLNMFRHENVQSLLSDFSLQARSKNSLPRYHRGSFALILRFVRNRVATNWDAMMDELLKLIENDKTVLMGLSYIQELYLHLHLYDVHSVGTLLLPAHLQHPGEGRLRNWTHVPSVVCVTLVVPREKLKVVTNIDTDEIGSPIMHCLTQSSPSYRARPWQNIFSNVQVSFGKLSGTGTHNTDSFQIKIKEDELRWRGNSPLIVSFMVPTWTLLLEPQTAKIAFGIQSTPDATFTFRRTLGLEMNIFTTILGDESNVFFTKYPPNQKDTLSLLPFPGSAQPASSSERSTVDSNFSANVDSTGSKITSLTCRLQLLSEDLQKALQSGGAVQTSQLSPCGFFETIGPNSIPIAFQFPAPVVKMKSKTRIARKSLYVEVEAPLADATVWKSFPALLYPVSLASGSPLGWNLSRLNLDSLPIIDISKKSELQWLTTHASGMFNVRERQLKNQKTSTNAESDSRFDFRDSLFSMFMHFTGLQGQQTHVMGLSNPTGGGVHLIVLISSLKLDHGNRTVVLDCAVLPLTHQLMPRLGPFLGGLHGRLCQIKVDAEEMQLWKQNLPAMVERCRSWPHQARCEYRAQSRIPLSTENGEAVVCSCGSGKFPAGFITDVPKWKSVSRHFVRAAISLSSPPRSQKSSLT